MYKRYFGVAIAAVMLAGCSSGITLPGGGKTETIHAAYQCDDGQSLDVTYYNQAPNRLAVVKKGPQPTIVMVNVIAGSGAKYVGNAYEWWTKGNSGTFTQLMGNKATECKSAR
ncbi:MAG: MliC family protein [Mixta calida]|nr:MliC family protein [Mixta calida]MDU3814763.1 MliC family protein [Pantoea sp.]POU40770.1 hypothetical protein C3380_23245 [Pantoea sp. PSNIH5]POU59068.1 hypothetical protein C3374_22950 [Pantoea sp. PSNIH4]POY65341.1 hypothetical protein C3402_23915 [Pantoea sp. PSNIH3]MDU2734741.1 MliC family protein [Mixta calida]